MRNVRWEQEPRDIVLESLRKLDRKFDLMAEDVHSINLRMGSVARHMAGLVNSEVDQNGEIDRLKRRVDCIERRLEPSALPE